MTTRSVAERVADVRRLVAAAEAVHRMRARWAPAIAAATGLSLPGVELGFSCLECDVSDADLRALVATASDADRVHVVLSSNVFVAPLRALALARAAAPRVSIRPSPRDPTLTHALIDTAGDPAIHVVPTRDVALSDADEIHVYGRDQTVDAVRARARAGTRMRVHGAGVGVALVTRTADIVAAASAIAPDVVLFDQRGCLSPRIVLVEGEALRAAAVARSLHEELTAWSKRVPRGALIGDERAQARRWIDALAFAGTVWGTDHHGVALAPEQAPLVLGPPGRHVLVTAVASLEDAAARLAPWARFVVAMGTDDPARIKAIAPRHARLSALGRMQRPPLDGPVDRRDSPSGNDEPPSSGRLRLGPGAR